MDRAEQMREAAAKALKSATGFDEDHPAVGAIRALLAQITPALVADEVAKEREALVKEREALVKERDEALEWLSASQGYIADAVFALDKQEKAEARAERLEAALRELRHRWYLGDLEEKDFTAALKGDDHE